MIDVVFVSALAFLVYTYLGYPLFIWLLGAIFPRPVRSGPCQPRVAAIVIARNEAARIHRKLESCLQVDYPKDKFHVLVASDGSDDGTNEIVSSFSDRGVELIAFPMRRGKAACLNDMVRRSDADIIVFTDARQRIEKNAIKCLVENFADPRVGAASAELEFENEDMTDFGKGVDLYWRYEKFIRLNESRLNSAVGVTGALYAVRRQCFRDIPPDTILDDVVIPMNVVMQGFRVVFEGRAKAFDVPSQDHSVEKRRKIRTIAGNYQLIVAHPGFFVPFHNPLFMQLLSHKVFRLLSPFVMAVLLATSISLASQGLPYQFVLVAQLLFYALPLLGLISLAARKTKIVTAATAFLLLNWFAVLGCIEFARNRNAHLWNSA